MYSEKLSRRKRILKTLVPSMKHSIRRTRIHKRTKDIEVAKSMIMKLQLQVYRKVIEGIEEKELQRVYRELLVCIRMDIIDMETVARRLKALKYLIRAYFGKLLRANNTNCVGVLKISG